MHLKLMGRVNGDHRMVEVIEYAFHRHPVPKVVYSCLSSPAPGAPVVECTVELEATAYVLNRDGKTIETLTTHQTDRKTQP